MHSNQDPVQPKINEQYNIDEFLTVSFLLKSPSQNYALIMYVLNDDKLNLIENGSLNKIFNMTTTILKRKYGLDIKDLMLEYPYEKIRERKNR